MPKSIYLDACVYISVAKKDGVVSKNYGEDIYSLVMTGEINIRASALLLDEVGKEHVKEDLSKLNSILRDRTIVAPEPVTELIIEAAKSIQKLADEYWQKGTSTKLSLKDAIHLEIAYSYGVDEFHTCDKKLLGLDPRVLRDSKMIITTPDNSCIYKRHRDLFSSNLYNTPCEILLEEHINSREVTRGDYRL
ncbi:MAG: PIN domain-containing protein [Gammaproteobacteria bacterium]|nr:PIN domain-containing protein [Gammaproteobacteria bacterium]